MVCPRVIDVCEVSVRLDWLVNLTHSSPDTVGASICLVGCESAQDSSAMEASLVG